MKRTDLIALAERVEHKYWQAPDSPELALADFARQIAQAQPVGWRTEQTMKSGDVYRDCIAGERKPYFGVARLYTLPLED